MGPAGNHDHADGPPHVRRSHQGQIDEILDLYDAAGIENILALGGDPPTDRPTPHRATTRTHRSARAGTRAARFSVGVAAHPRATAFARPRSDRGSSPRKLRVADFAITQFFFEADHYVRLVDELDALGVHKPVIPGIMPVTNMGQVARMSQLSGAAFPSGWPIGSTMPPIPEEVRRIGVEVATELCLQLLERVCPACTSTRSIVPRPRGRSGPTSACPLCGDCPG